jgi:hypothetical protein
LMGVAVHPMRPERCAAPALTLMLSIAVLRNHPLQPDR